MGSNQHAAESAGSECEDFEPQSELVHEKDCDTLLVHLPGFEKEQLKVELTAKGLLISGKRPLEGNKSSRLQKCYAISTNYDTNKITAEFNDGILHIRQPKLIITLSKEQNHDGVQKQPQPSEDQKVLNQKSRDELDHQPEKNDVKDQASFETTSTLTSNKSKQRERKIISKVSEKEKKSNDMDGDGRMRRKTSERDGNYGDHRYTVGGMSMNKLVMVVLLAFMVGHYLKNWLDLVWRDIYEN